MINSQGSASLYSHHIFVFPFKWDKGDQSANFASRTDLDELSKLLGDQPALVSDKLNLNWKRFHCDWKEQYNEIIYFHPFVRDVLFDTGKKNDLTVLQYHIPCTGKRLQYQIRINGKPENCDERFTLEIDELTLNFYTTGIGFLAFHLSNFEHNNPNELLKINDFGRRIFPQFLGSDSNRLQPVKGAFLADQIAILKNGVETITENFEGLLKKIDKQERSFEDNEFLLPKFISHLLPKDIKSINPIAINPLLDDRMHVICWTGDKKWLDGKYDDEDKDSTLRWHSYIFVDGSMPGIKNIDKAKMLNQKHTYQRWVDDGLLYGVSRYSFVILGDEQNDFHRYVILKHLQTIYFQIVMLSLLQRGSIVRFSEEITRLARSKDGHLDEHSEDVKSLYSKYLNFVNKFYFREVTPQEQGIELYKMVQENMEIERDVKALQAEIHDFFNLLDLKASEQQSAAMDTLTIIGSGLLIPSLILAYYGVSAFPDISNKLHFSYHWVPTISILGMASGLLFASLWIKVRHGHIATRLAVGILAVGILFTIFYFTINAPLWWYAATY